MKQLKVIILAALVAAGVALTYFYFEAAVRNAIDLVWNDWLGTGSRRYLVPAICIVLALVYFGMQHWLDPHAEKHASHGLGDAPLPTVASFVKVLGLGFLSLVAGASLGPEAVLVPACVLLGGYVGERAYGRYTAASTAGAVSQTGSEPLVKLLGMAGFIALMTAFFHSFLVGVLALLLIKKQYGVSLKPLLIVLAVVVSEVTVLVLGQLESPAFVRLPPYDWRVNLGSLLALLLLGLAGYATTYLMGWSQRLVTRAMRIVAERPWWLHAIAAAAGLSVLYLLGGSLVEFTGNESIIPMFQQAAELGVLGLLWLYLVKVMAISWSKATGYRGGLVFPAIFVAAVLVAIAQMYIHDLNLIYGLIVVLAGALVADAKVKVLL